MILEGFSSTIFCPTYHVNYASCIAFHPRLFKEEALRLVRCEDSATMIHILVAVSELTEYATFDPKTLLETCASCIGPSSSPHLVNAACKVVNSCGTPLYLSEIYEQLEYWINKSYIPFELIETILRLFKKGILESNFKMDTFLKASIRFSTSDLPVNLRMTVALCLSELVEKIDVESNFIDFYVLMDRLVQDDDDQVRKVSIATIASYLKMEVCKIYLIDRYRKHRWCLESDLSRN
jgi:hypothetical protein